MPSLPDSSNGDRHPISNLFLSRFATWLPGAIDNRLVDVANGRPIAVSECVTESDWREFSECAGDAYRHGAALTWGLRRQTSLGNWVYWPLGVPSLRPLAVVSSRIGRDPAPWRPWFAALRAAIQQTDPWQEIIMTVDGTTTALYLQHCAARFQIPTMTVVLAKRRVDRLIPWLHKVVAQSYHLSHTDSARYRALVAPLVAQSLECSGLSEPTPARRIPRSVLPLRDLLLLDTAQRLLVLHSRPGGTVDQLVRRTLADATRPVGSVQVLLADGLIAPRLRDDYLSAGAVGWEPPPDSAPIPVPIPQASKCGLPPPIDSPARVIPFSQFRQELRSLERMGISLLSHCTRRCRGPWPEQSPNEYLDDLIFAGGMDDRSPAGVLARIVRRRRITGVAGMFRGGYRGVSFSQVPLPELLRMRAFRAHRGVWTFEPYGICIASSALQAIGARPVDYGDDDRWQELSEQDRPFYQQRFTRGRHGKTVDWSVEREWRVIGDVPLNELPNDQIWLFVASDAEAVQLARISPWPIVCVQA